MKGFPGYDKLTSDRSAMDDWTVNHLFPAYANSGISISKDTYGPKDDGHYYPGIGLAQWTGSRAKALYDFSKQNNKDWASLDAQLDYFTNGPGEFKYRKPGLREALNNLTNPEEAASKFGYDFEGHITKSEATRKQYARNFFNRLSGVNDAYNPSESGSSSIGSTLSSVGSGALGILSKIGTIFSTVGSAMFEDLLTGNWKNRDWKATLAAALAGESSESSSEYSSDYYSSDYYSGDYSDTSGASAITTANTGASKSMSNLWSIATAYSKSYNSVKDKFDKLSDAEKQIVRVLANKYVGSSGSMDKLNSFYQEASLFLYHLL